MSDRTLAEDEIAKLIEAGCISVYGKNWNGPEDKRPGEPMKRVWRDLVAKAQAPVLAALRAQATADGRVEAMRALAAESAFLVARLSDFENDHLRDDDGSARDWYGHVDPSLDRLRSLLTLIAIRALPSKEAETC